MPNRIIFTGRQISSLVAMTHVEGKLQVTAMMKRHTDNTGIVGVTCRHIIVGTSGAKGGLGAPPGVGAAALGLAALGADLEGEAEPKEWLQQQGLSLKLSHEHRQFSG